MNDVNYTDGFFEFVILNFLSEDTPEGDFARDLLHTRKAFPHIGYATANSKGVAKRTIGYKYICGGAQKAFDNIWQSFVENFGLKKEIDDLEEPIVKPMTGEDVKELIKYSGVKFWQVAEALGINDGNFSRKLRHELSDDEVEQIVNIINEIKERNNK